MKNLCLKLILIMALSLSVLACEKDDDDNIVPTGTQTEQLSGTYKLFMDGNLVAEGSTKEVGMIKNNEQNYSNVISMANGEAVSILVNGFSLETGQTVNISEGSGPGITITGKNLLLTDSSDEMYFAKSGSLTRTSGSKISFEGTCSVIMSQDTHTFSGYVESEAYKEIK